jgi:hypothetical protein
MSERLLGLPHYDLPPRNGDKRSWKRQARLVKYKDGKRYFPDQHRSRHDPCSDEIAAMCLMIQQEWTPGVRLARRLGKHNDVVLDEVVNPNLRICRYASQGWKLTIARNLIEHTDEQYWDSH